MFGSKTMTIVQLTHTAISVTQFEKRGKELVVKKRLERDCTSEQYPTAFTAISKEFHTKTIRILLPEEDTYLKLLVFDSVTVPTRELVIEKAKEVIPEPLENGFIDWKRVPLGTSGVGVQVFVVKKEVLRPILAAADHAGITVESCEPPSFAMARMAAHVDEPFLLVYPAVKPTHVFAVRSGSVLEVLSVDPLNALEDTKHTMCSYVAKTWGITIRAIATTTPDPVVGLASKTDVVGEDMNVLNIPVEEKTLRSSSRKLALPLPLLIGIIIILIGAIVFFGIKLVQMRAKTALPTPVSLQQPVVSPAPTSVPRTRDSISIEVQNGSGVAGYAGKGKKVLEDLGYTTVTTANADSYDYTGVTVRGKTTEISTIVYNDIKGTYTSATVSGALLDSGVSTDALVILGKEN